MAKYDIFISYRREGGYDTAKHLYDLLTRDGYKVSFDIDTLRNGDFDKSLLNRIDECKDFILIVDAHAFDRTLDPSFNPQNDWLRQELAHALKKGKNIIPIFLNNVRGFPQNLPIDIADVSKKNGPEYNQYYFNDFYKVLKIRFLTSTKGNSIGVFVLIAIILCSIGCLCYSIPREGEATNLCVSIYAILWAITLFALIAGLANPKMIFFNHRAYASLYIIPLILSMSALGCGVNEVKQNVQNQDYTPYLTAKQMNIYFGNPKSVVSKRSNGYTNKTCFDKNGRVTSVSIKDNKMVYDWKSNNQLVIMSYSNNEFSASNLINISELSKSRYAYTVGGAIDVNVEFNSNETIQEINITNPKSTYTAIYHYNSDKEIYPTSVIQKMNDQTIKVKITIDQLDDKGNPIRFSESFLGNTIEANQIIEYY